MGRPKRPNGNTSNLDSVLKPLAGRCGVAIRNFILPNSKLKSALFGDVLVTASVANTESVIYQTRKRFQEDVDDHYAVAAHAYAVGTPTARVEMSLRSFNEIMARLIEADPSYYLRQVHARKDSDE